MQSSTFSPSSAPAENDHGILSGSDGNNVVAGNTNDIQNDTHNGHGLQQPNAAAALSLSDNMPSSHSNNTTSARRRRRRRRKKQANRELALQTQLQQQRDCQQPQQQQPQPQIQQQQPQPQIQPQQQPQSQPQQPFPLPQIQQQQQQPQELEAEREIVLPATTDTMARKSLFVLRPVHKYADLVCIALSVFAYLLETTMNAALAIFGIGVGVGLVLGDSFRAALPLLPSVQAQQQTTSNGTTTTAANPATTIAARVENEIFLPRDVPNLLPAQ